MNYFGQFTYGKYAKYVKFGTKGRSCGQTLGTRGLFITGVSPWKPWRNLDPSGRSSGVNSLYPPTKSWLKTLRPTRGPGDDPVLLCCPSTCGRIRKLKSATWVLGCLVISRMTVTNDRVNLLELFQEVLHEKLQNWKYSKLKMGMNKSSELIHINRCKASKLSKSTSETPAINSVILVIKSALTVWNGSNILLLSSTVLLWGQGTKST